MNVPHLGPWIGAVAGLRAVTSVLALSVALTYRHHFLRMVRQRFNAHNVDADRGIIAALSFGGFLWGVYALVLIYKTGGVPADKVLWSRLLVASAYVAANFGYTTCVATMIARAAGRREGRRAFWWIYAVTGIMMAAGAAL